MKLWVGLVFLVKAAKSDVAPYCCSWNLKTCSGDTWCDASLQNCKQCEGIYINPSERPTCTAHYAQCQEGSTNCCAPASCIFYNQWWSQCDTTCCSWDLKTCGEDAWCNSSSNNCGQCGGSYIDPLKRQTCKARWDACTSTDKCCGDATCVQLDGYQGCDLPATPAPGTLKPTTAQPVPVTPKPTTAKPITPAPGTPKPTTAKPVTPKPTTAKPVTPKPTTAKPVTPKPTTAKPVTPKPTTAKPVTPKPTTAKPVTPKPTTAKPVTPKPTTATPGTPKPTTAAPVTPRPTTLAPVTPSPTTAAPVTPRPTTLTPVTPRPTTAAPVSSTPKPTTSAPVTSAPVASPVNLPSLPAGPYITASKSSERIVIPDPAVPNLTTPKTGCPHLDSGLVDWHQAGLTPATAGTNVVLPSNTRVVIQQSVTVELGLVTIPSTSELIFGENVQGIAFDVAGMDVQGNLTAGSETCKIGTPVTITLHGSRPSDIVTNPRPATFKGISVTGRISLHGKRFYRTWTRLAKTVAIGESVLMLQHAVNWEPGQEIVLVTTAMKDSREWHQNEVMVISSLHPQPPSGVGAAVFLTAPVKYKHAANAGYQAEVGLLTRTIKIQGAANDSEPTDRDPLTCTGDAGQSYGNSGRPCPNTQLTGFGGHVMVQGTGRGRVEGVEFYRMGQTNVLGRYPVHFHLLGDCPECYLRDSSVHRSYYRCISIHGTNFMTATENVAFNVTGYCYYLEDGVEHDNTVSFNLAAHIHMIGPNIPFGWGQTTNTYAESSSLTLPADVTAAGFYITNVHNNIIGNAASGGWAGFAFPNLPTPLGVHKTLNMRPSLATGLTIDGNTAHSTGWWWGHAGAFYFGGALYYNSGGKLEYNPGRDFDFNNHGRNTCSRDLCGGGNCGDYCQPYEQLWVRMTNSKAFLAAGPGLNSWSGRMEIVGFEAHDCGLSMEALEAGFWIDNMLCVCRTGEPMILPPGASATAISGTGFFWYDTNQEHIMTTSLFRNCGYRSTSYAQYDNSTTRGCGTDAGTGCWSGSTVFGFLTHSDEFNPELMQGTKAITFQNCGRRFKLSNFLGDNAPSTVSGRTQNWIDTDGSVTGLNVPALIGSGMTDCGLWWTVDNQVISDPQGPLKFIKTNNGPQRGLGSFRLLWDSVQHNKVGSSVCGNGNGLPCPALGYIRHLGKKFSSDNGLPVTANADITGPVGGFGWLLKLTLGAPRAMRIELVEVRPETPLLMNVAYPPGTSFTITAHAAWCSDSAQYKCTEVFHAVTSREAVHNSIGNTYYFDSSGLLTFRVIQTPKTYVGRPDFFLPTFSDVGPWGAGHAIDSFERNGVLLPMMAYGPWLDVVANCPPSSSNSAYCSQAPPNLDPDVCPSGYTQVAYDSCCSTTNTSQCIFANGSSS